MAGRFILGFGNSFSHMCSPLLLTEICHPQHRGPLTAVYNCLWNLGALSKFSATMIFSAWLCRTLSYPSPGSTSAAAFWITLSAQSFANGIVFIVVSLVGWGTSKINNDWCWRSITLIQIVPSLFQLCGLWWIPESPRFLISKDKADKALEVLVKHHGGGDVNNPTVQFEYREIRETITMETQVNRTTNYVDFLKTKGNRWRLAIIISLGVISQYSGNALVSNYINYLYEGAGIRGENKKLGVSYPIQP